MKVLEELWNELHKGKVVECSLRDSAALYYGMVQDGTVYVDPRPAILDTVVHELLHRRYPTMSEREVRSKTARLVFRMDEATKRKWWRAYSRVKRKGRPVDMDADD